jgi:hypothetical protein
VYSMSHAIEDIYLGSHNWANFFSEKIGGLKRSLWGLALHMTIRFYHLYQFVGSHTRI